MKKSQELIDFVIENKNAGGLNKLVVDQVKELWNKYKLTQLASDCSIIEGDFGRLGSLITREIKSIDGDISLKYESGSYDYVSIVSKNATYLLWTDYSPEQPYDRTSGLYCGGMSWQLLGKPIIEKPEYREFQYVYEYLTNISFAVWGFDYNDFYGSVRFGLCIKTENVKKFTEELRKIIDKV